MLETELSHYKSLHNITSDTELQDSDLIIIVSKFQDVINHKLGQTFPNNPKQQYVPGQEGEEKKMKHFGDGGYHQISSRLTNNAFELKGVGINRWEPLFFDPQKNSIEPFRRIGDNTVLHTLDQHVSDCGNV